MNGKKIVFLGTPQISAFVLEGLVRNGFNVVSVVTKEDKVRSRGNKVEESDVAKTARILHLDLPAEKEGNEFGVELPDEIDSSLNDLTLTTEMLQKGNRLADMKLPQGTLVMLVKRDNEFIIPNGQLELHPGDKLLLISENKKEQA